MKINEILKEWLDPGPPCSHCGKPLGKHTVRLVSKNPKVTNINPDAEWINHDVVNAEDHEFEPTTNYQPLTQQEAERVGFDILSSSHPDDIYNLINRARYIRRVK